MRCCATCRGHRSPHWHRSRFSSQRRSPSRWATFEGRSPGVGRTGWVCGGRRESVHGVLAATSMPRTPPQTHPARPRTVSVCVHHGKEREDQKQKRIASLCIHAWRGSTESTKVDTHRQSRLTHRHRETVGGGAVWGSRTVGAMDGAIEPPGTGLRRVLQPHTAPPNQQKARAAFDVAVAVALSRCRAASPAEPPTTVGWADAALQLGVAADLITLETCLPTTPDTHP